MFLTVHSGEKIFATFISTERFVIRRLCCLHQISGTTLSNVTKWLVEYVTNLEGNDVWTINIILSAREQPGYWLFQRESLFLLGTPQLLTTPSSNAIHSLIMWFAKGHIYFCLLLVLLKVKMITYPFRTPTDKHRNKDDSSCFYHLRPLLWGTSE